MKMNENYTRLLITSLLVLCVYQIILVNHTCISKEERNTHKNSAYLDKNELAQLIREVRHNSKLDVFKAHVDLFKLIGLKYGTDKVTTHHYEHLYGQVLGPYLNTEMNFLEIGLGCGMPYGPGKSIPIWKELLPKANISILEYDAECASKFKNKVNNLFTGDQSNLQLVDRIGQEVGPFDVIVDDGGHSRKQQVNSVIGLWPYVASKGVYVVEDFFTSFLPSYNDNEQSAFDLVVELIILLNNPSALGYSQNNLEFPNIKIAEHAKAISESLLSISCFERACVLFKK